MPDPFQNLCNHIVVITLAASSAEPIIITGTTAAAKIAVRPTILYQAAIPLRDNAISNVRVDKLNIFLSRIIYIFMT
jgi:hypothetical protein